MQRPHAQPLPPADGLMSTPMSVMKSTMGIGNAANCTIFTNVVTKTVPGDSTFKEHIRKQGEVPPRRHHEGGA